MASTILPEIKPIPNWPTYYAGENGRIYLRIHSATQLVSNVKKNSEGYLTVPLMNENSKWSVCYVHALIAETWLENPTSNQEGYDKFQLKHLNKNQLDNRVENLYWEPIRKSNFLRRFLHWPTNRMSGMYNYE